MENSSFQLDPATVLRNERNRRLDNQFDRQDELDTAISRDGKRVRQLLETRIGELKALPADETAKGLTELIAYLEESLKSHQRTLVFSKGVLDAVTEVRDKLSDKLWKTRDWSTPKDDQLLEQASEATIWTRQVMQSFNKVHRTLASVPPGGLQSFLDALARTWNQQQVGWWDDFLQQLAVQIQTNPNLWLAFCASFGGAFAIAATHVCYTAPAAAAATASTAAAATAATAAAEAATACAAVEAAGAAVTVELTAAAAAAEAAAAATAAEATAAAATAKATAAAAAGWGAVFLPLGVGCLAGVWVYSVLKCAEHLAGQSAEKRFLEREGMVGNIIVAAEKVEGDAEKFLKAVMQVLHPVMTHVIVSVDAPERCSMCLEEFGEGSMMVVNADNKECARHLICCSKKDCLRTALANKKQCPVCRTAVRATCVARLTLAPTPARNVPDSETGNPFWEDDDLYFDVDLNSPASETSKDSYLPAASGVASDLWPGLSRRHPSANH